jgi:hypothetical protein
MSPCSTFTFVSIDATSFALRVCFFPVCNLQQLHRFFWSHFTPTLFLFSLLLAKPNLNNLHLLLQLNLCFMCPSSEASRFLTPQCPSCIGLFEVPHVTTEFQHWIGLVVLLRKKISSEWHLWCMFASGKLYQPSTHLFSTCHSASTHPLVNEEIDQERVLRISYVDGLFSLNLRSILLSAPSSYLLNGVSFWKT